MPHGAGAGVNSMKRSGIDASALAVATLLVRFADQGASSWKPDPVKGRRRPFIGRNTLVGPASGRHPICGQWQCAALLRRVVEAIFKSFVISLKPYDWGFTRIRARAGGS